MKKIIIAATVAATMTGMAFAAAPAAPAATDMGANIGVRVGAEGMSGIVIGANYGQFGGSVTMSHSKVGSTSTRVTELGVTYTMNGLVVGASQAKNDAASEEKTSSVNLGFTTAVGGNDSLTCMTNLFSKTKTHGSDTKKSGEFNRSFCTLSHSFSLGGAAK